MNVKYSNFTSHICGLGNTLWRVLYMKRNIETIDNQVHIECSRCHKMVPATSDYYSKAKQGKLGLDSRCKLCKKAIKEEKKDDIKAYYQRNAEHFKEYSRQYKKDNPEKVKETIKKSYIKHREKNLESKRIFHLENKDKEKQYRMDNKERITKRYKEYVVNNPEKRKQTVRNHRENNRDKYRAYQQVRTARNKGLISTLELNEWEECLVYFNHKDAYTGLDMIKPSQDHVIPISKDGSYVKTNIVPCELGVNSSKGNRDLEEWYRKQSYFSEERLKKIYKWIGYNEKLNIQQLSIL